MAVLAVMLLLARRGWVTLRHYAKPARLLDPRPHTQTLANTTETMFARRLALLTAQRPGQTGIYTLEDPREAFAARMLLIRGAEYSLDIQYYIWHPDVAGTLLIQAIREAADRGVRVRLLLDDNGTGGLDTMMAMVDSHPLIEVRLFNPFVIRWPKTLNYLLDFHRLNRRMHNKSLTADNLLTIAGGRNIGDEYLASSDLNLFDDFDVLAIGAVVPDVSADFDRYWACDSAYLAERILPLADARSAGNFAKAVARASKTGFARNYADAVRDNFLEGLLSGSIPFDWAMVTMVSDDPAKGLHYVRRKELFATRLASIVSAPERELGLISAYFVPTAAGIDSFAALAARGVEVDILTNALKANDVAVVHAGYAPCRIPLLKAGVRLWELKGADPAARARLRFRGSVGGGLRRRGAAFRVSGSALHAKAFTIDRDRMFVGSFNFDPRSLRLNTELGFVIDSPALAAWLQDLFVGTLPDIAYEVRLGSDGQLIWIEQTATGTVIHAHEPGTGPLQRLILAGLSRLPIRWLL
ncbi:phospholipase D family protein [Sandarakinorhabdus glacialis]|uniref:phospholipase D family protein n=1 Tax=Sandarakinorhabdus glacialis TaxID=1614636 RepID=UPI001A9C2E33|nr:phospholipase D family protein [Polymorphobacter glacialis]